MSIYRDKCDEIQRMVREITSERAFGAQFGIVVSNTDDCIPKHWDMVKYVEDKFFDDIYIIAKKLRELLDKDETKAAQVKRQDGYSIKSARDEALMYLYKRYNNLAGLEEIDYGTAETMRVLIGDIEKLEHARHMEMSDEVAKLSIEKLGDMAEPWPKVVSNITEEQVEKLRRDVCGKKGEEK